MGAAGHTSYWVTRPRSSAPGSFPQPRGVSRCHLPREVLQYVKKKEKSHQTPACALA